PGDIGVFTYSGHGTQTADLPPIDEEDMLDEAIVPIDALNDQSNLIRDDEFHAILSNVPEGAKFVCVLDSCHSGDGTRFFDMPLNHLSIPRARTIEDVKNIFNGLNNNERRELPRPKPRFFPPIQTIGDIKMIMKDLGGPTKKNVPSFSGPNHVLLAGCKSNQSSLDDGTYGYFTKALIENIQNGITYKELYSLASNIVLERSNNAQAPQLEGPDSLINSPIFE
ncbi:caspase family protein, partial [Bacillus toyonensis]